MKPRLLIPLLAALAVGLFACAKQLGDGSACFESSECKGGSICAATVYGNFCMKTCGPDVVRCEDAEACLMASEVGAGGAGGDGGAGGVAGDGGAGGMGGAGGIGGSAGMGGVAGMGGAAGDGGSAGMGGAAGDGGSAGMGGAAGAGGAGGMGGLAGMGGAAGDGGAGGMGGSSGTGGAGGQGGGGGEGGVGGSPEDEIWVCLPGALNLETSEIIPRVTGSPCDYSIECMVGGVCVHNPAGMCSGQGMEGPTCCAELCNPDIANQCPGGLVCIDLGTGRGFCGPSVTEEN